MTDFQQAPAAGRSSTTDFVLASHRFLFHPHPFPVTLLQIPVSDPPHFCCLRPTCIPPTSFPRRRNITFFLSQTIYLACKTLVKIKPLELCSFCCLYSRGRHRLPVSKEGHALTRSDFTIQPTLTANTS